MRQMTSQQVLVAWLSLLGLAVIIGVIAVRSNQPNRVHYPSGVKGSEWKLETRTSSDEIKKLIFAIKHPDPSALDELLRRVSDPGSSSYGQYLSLEELREITRNEDGINAVRQFLSENGITDLEETKNGEFIVARVPIKVAESVLDTEFYDVRSNHKVASIAQGYSLPEQIARYVDFIGGTSADKISMNARIVSHSSDDTSASGRLGFVTPSILNKVYNVKSNLVSDKRSTQSVFESLGQSYSPVDLFMFEEQFGLPKRDVHRIIGPNQDEICDKHPESCGEANLDVQYIMAMAVNAHTTYWSMEGSVEPFLEWAMDVCNDTKPPLVHSISYGDTEDEPAIMQRFSQEIQKLGIRGVTVVVSSGDDGVANYDARNDLEKCGFSASFPASCPYVIAVGATQGPESNREEVACSSDTGGIITSGGGFSAVFEAPSYQKDAIAEFFGKSRESDIPPLDLFDHTGRAYPDVALLGYNYMIVDGEQWAAESGTSASAPVFAGMLSLINGKLLAAGRPPLGFVNPLLYKLRHHPGIFNDIVKGNNHCVAARELTKCCKYGFSSTEGYDPVTGLGSVNFDNLLSAILDSIPPVHLREPIHVAQS